MVADEEERAAAHRAQARRRAAAKRDQLAALAGDPAAAARVREAWQPVVDAQRERRTPEIPTIDVPPRRRTRPSSPPGSVF